MRSEYQSGLNKWQLLETLVSTVADRRVVFLDSCFRGEKYDFLAGWGSKRQSFLTLEEAFERPGWHFGFIPYEYKNALESRSFPHKKRDFPQFFTAEGVIFRRKGNLIWETAGSGAEVLALLKRKFPPKSLKNTSFRTGKFHPLMSKKEYLQALKALQEHIAVGDIYEVNLTHEYRSSYQGSPDANFIRRFWELNRTGMSAFYSDEHRFILSASPERFLRLDNQTLSSEPIKGTVKRSPHLFSDRRRKEQLRHVKYEAENVMIVDLVRNDLNRVCVPGSVGVPSLFRIETFTHLHHLVSTIEGTLEPEKTAYEAINACFPPGSMTGAPKIRAMQLTDEYETTLRGIYSGAVGYISPEKNFDFNVVIRTLIGNIETGELSYHVGGAITIDSDPESEYAETQLKARFIRSLER